MKPAKLLMWSTLLAISLLASVQVWAEGHTDLAPLGKETVEAIRKITLINKRSPAAQDISNSLEQISAIAGKEESTQSKIQPKGRKPAVAQSAQSLLDSKAVEIKTAKDQILREMNEQGALLDKMGLLGQARLDEKKRQVEDQFARIEKNIGRARETRGIENKKALKGLHGLMRELSGSYNEEIGQSKPKPNFQGGRPAPIETPVTSPVPPAYIDHAGNEKPISLLVEPQQEAGAPAAPPTGCNATAADLDINTREAKVTSEIAALANQLDYSPVKIFQHVSNNIKFEPYWGLLKGAQGTLVAGSGGSMDQAALLVALMRASNYPARYVRGTIQFSGGNWDGPTGSPGLRWLGAKSYQAALSILLYNNTTAAIATGGNGIQFTHAWAEICVPYSNYRGTQADASGARWIPLDPSYKDNVYQKGVPQTSNFDYVNYLSKRTMALPHEAYAAQVEQTIKSSDAQLGDVPYKATQHAIQYDILPASLPYQVASFDAWDADVAGFSTAETAVVPDSHRYRFVLDLKNVAGTALMPTQKYWMSDIALNRLSLGWQGATALDQAALDAWKSQSLETGLPCGAVNVKPELRLDGVLQVVGTAFVDGCSTANNLSMRIEIDKKLQTIPHAWIVSVTNSENIGASSVYALHTHAYQTSDRLLKERAERLLASVQANPSSPNIAGDEILAEFLHLSLLKWMRYTSDAVKLVGDLDGTYPGIGLHLGLTGSQMKVDYAFDVPFAVHRTGYLIDVGSYVSFPLDLTSGALSWKTFMLGGYSGSAYESFIWQETAGLDAISTVRGIQYASEQGIEILTLTPDLCSGSPAPIDAQLYKLTHNSDTSLNYTNTNFYRSEICTKGKTITLPRSLVNYLGSWKGAVYISESNVQFAERADFIIEKYAGGFTVRDLMRAGLYDDLEGMGYDTWFLKMHPSLWWIWNGAATPSNAWKLINYIDDHYINGMYNTGYSPSPYSSVNSTGCSGGGQPNLSRPTNNYAPYVTPIDDYLNGGYWGGADSVYVGDPVNVVTGNMYLSQSDLNIKGRCDLHLAFNRSYNSQMPKDGALGYGWTHNYNNYLVFLDANTNNVTDAGDSDNATSSVIWVDGTGVVRYFSVSGSVSGVPAGAQFQIAPGLYFTMTRQGDGTYLVREKSGVTYKFENLPGTVNQIAKLIAVAERNDNAITLAYTAGKLTTVTDSVNRRLTFTYNAGGRIQQMQDWTGRQYQYEYDANGNLITYKNPLAVKGQQTPTRYEYYADAAVDSSGAQSPRNRAMKRYVLPLGNGETFEYYMNGKVFKEYNAVGETNTFTYNPYRRETVMTNTRGITRSYTFDPNGNPTQIATADGGVRTHTYDCVAPGTTDCANPFNKISTKDAQGNTVGYQYDAQGNVTQLTKPGFSGGVVTLSYYNAFGMPGLITDANGNIALSKFDTKGNLLEEIRLKSGYYGDIDPATYTPLADYVTSWTINTYDTFGNLSSTKRVKDAATKTGPSMVYARDAQGLNLTSMTRTGMLGSGMNGSETAAFKYDALGRMKSGVDADWQPIQMSYDDLDRVVQSTDKIGNLRSLNYDANGNLLSVKINTGAGLVDERSFTYDLADRKITETDSGGNISKFAYDAAGNLTSQTNPDGYSVAYVYDERDRLIGQSDAKGNATIFKRNLNGKPLEVTDPNGVIISKRYTPNGKLLSESKPYGPSGNGPSGATEFYYDNNDNPYYSIVTSYTDGSKVTYSQYDELNRLVRQVGPLVSTTGVHPVTRTTYDLLGNVIKVEMGSAPDGGYWDPAQDTVAPQFTYTWDDYGHRLSKTDGNGKTWSYKYDKYGNLIQSTDAKAQSVFYTWGYGHQLSCVTQNAANAGCAANANLLKKYTRDYLGQVVQAYSPTVTYSYNYDTSHRVSSVTDSRASKSLSYLWSPGGSLERLATGDGQVVDYQYDALGQLAGVWAPNGDYVTLSWDAGGRLSEKWFPNGVNTQFSYNDDGSLKQVKNRNGYSDANLISQHDYTYDGFGNRITHAENINGSPVNWTYTYDDLMRLVSADNGDPAQLQTNEWDLLNNRTRVLVGNPASPGQASYYQYDAANQLTATRSGSATGPLTAAFVYDPNGSLTQQCQGGSITASAIDCTGATVTDTVYDPLSRISQVTRTGQPVQTYAYDDQDRRVRRTSAGSLPSDYIYQGQDILIEYANGWGEATGFITHGAAIDIPLIWEPAANDPLGARYFHQDGLNTVVVATTISGNTATQRYDAFGNRTASTGLIPLYGYTGREQDGLGYTYYRARYYDPSQARFTQRDPIELGGGINLYAYVGGNPVNFTDPSGLVCLSDAQIGGISGALGGGFGGAVAGFAVGGIPGALAMCTLGAVAGGLAGTITNSSDSRAIALGAASGGLGGANTPLSSAFGGAAGAATASALQSNGVPSDISGIVGGGVGGTAGGLTSALLTGSLTKAATAGGLAGLSSAALTAGTSAILKSLNSCPK